MSLVSPRVREDSGTAPETDGTASALGWCRHVAGAVSLSRGRRPRAGLRPADARAFMTSMALHALHVKNRQRAYLPTVGTAGFSFT